MANSINKKIFITGGAGFIGSNFILQALGSEKNFKILNFDKLTYAGNLSNLSSISSSPQYSFKEGDICEIEILSRTIFEFRPDIILHFAAESHVDRSIDNPLVFIKSNVNGTANLLNVALSYYKKLDNTKEFKFIHVSTDEVFGSLGSDGFFTENSPYRPTSPYSSSKAGSDHLVRAWNITYGLPTVITNCSNNYGPLQFPEKLIPLIITNCIDEDPLPVYGDGKNIRDWLFVEDHCEALKKVIMSGAPGQNYNIGGDCELTNIDIVTKICSIMDELKPRISGKLHSDLIKFVDDRPGHDFRYAIDSKKIKDELNWKQEESIDTGLRKTIKWYINNESWWREIQNNKYNRQ